MNIFFLMNGNIFNHSLASEEYSWKCNCGLLGCSTCRAYAIPPNPPTSTNTITGEPIFVKSYINAYNTAFNQSNDNYQRALYRYIPFTHSEVDSNFVPVTFGYYEWYTGNISNLQSNIVIDKLKNDLKVYFGTPYLFVSAGSGSGPGFMYINWIIVTYGVTYVVSVS